MSMRPMVLGPLGHSIHQAPKFGCRMEAHIASMENPSSEQDTFRLQCFQSENSLLAQSRPGRPQKDGVRDSYTIEDLSNVIRRIGNVDGFGIAAFVQGLKETFTFKSPKAAFQTPDFLSILKKVVDLRPNIILAHVRAASDKATIGNAENNHPFQFGPWQFMHNGHIGGAHAPVIQEKLREIYIPLLGEGPKGKTDSEAAFYYFMGKLKQAYGQTAPSLKSSEIGRENIRKVFALAIQELIDNTPHQTKNLDGAVLGAKGKIQISASCNFIVSDGNILLAHRKGAKLYVGLKTMKNGEKEFIVASEKFQPAKQKGSIQWADLENDDIAMFYKDPETKQVEWELMPRSVVLAQS